MPKLKKRRVLDHVGETSYSTGEYDTAEEAAAAASSIFNPMSMRDKREVGGGIIKNPETGKYRFTYTLGDTGSVNIKIRKKKSEELVGLWHTHGDSHSDKGMFSGDDARTVRKTQLPFYMTDVTGKLRVMAPGKVKGQRGNPGEVVMRPDGNPYVIRTELNDVLSPRRPVVGFTGK